jgi:hypothetical protein
MKLGDRMLAELARRRLATVAEKAINRKTGKLDFGMLSSGLEGLAGKHGNKDEYLDALLQNAPDVRKALKDMEGFMGVIEPSRRVLGGGSTQQLSGSAELSAPEQVLSKMDVATRLILRWIYGAKLAPFVTGEVDRAVNPLLGGLRPALPDATVPIKVLNTLRRGATSAQRNVFGQ